MLLVVETAGAQQWRATKSTLYQAFTGAIGRYEESRVGLGLAQQASAISLSGRPAEAEALAERSFAVLKSRYPADHPILLQPLQILTSALLDQRKIGRAREAVQRMRAVNARRPEDRALLAGATGALLQVEGRHPEAEALYLEALAAWQVAGKGESAEAATVLSSLGTLYIHAQRYDEARGTLDAALARLSPGLDRIKLLNNRAVLKGRQGRWPSAEADLREAVAMADREPKLDGVYMATLLTNYAQVLRRNRRVHEARRVEARAAATRSPSSGVVDVSEWSRGKYLW
jgi:tetratricopeptide (TPR) repeat protein